MTNLVLKSSLRLVGVALAALAIVHCASSKGSTSAPTSGSGSVGAAGGTVATSDGAVQLSIPAGALTSNVAITIVPTTAPGAGSLGTVYEIGPTGTQFASPVTLTLHYAGLALGGHDASELRIATYGGVWQTLTGFTEDTGAQTVSGTTMHLSPYAFVLEADGAVCVSVSGGASCGGSAGGGTPSCPQPTCAGSGATACSTFPGTTFQSCTDNSTSGYSGSCCGKPGAPFCITTTGSASCGGSAGGGTPSCPQPTCASAGSGVCSAYPGATASCVDNGTQGYTGTCCYPAGTVPPAPTSSSSGPASGGGSSSGPGG
jgi:ZU5 domain